MSGRIITAVTGVVILTIVAIAWYVITVAGEALAATTRFVIQASGVAIVAGLALTVIYLAIRLILGGLVFIEHLKQAHQKTAEFSIQQRRATAEVRKLEREAELTIVTAPSDHQVHISDLNLNAYWQARHLDPRIYTNGPHSDHTPKPWEVGLWLTTHQKPSKLPPSAPNALSLTAGTNLPERVDLADLLPGMRGSLRNIVLGMQINEVGTARIVSAPMFRLCHVGAAGATDSGKSNFGRAIAYQVLTANETVRVVISDLKATTFKAFKNSRRLLYPIIHSSGEFIAVMNELSDEMRRRKELFKPHPTVETLLDYNNIAQEALPYLVIFVDEVTNLFLNRDTQIITLEMLREARAFGMYFIAMGQSWSHKEMNTSIRQQFRTGLHFGTNDPASSRMIVNSSDAAKIVTPGRALASLPFGMSPGAIEIQTPYIDVATVLRALDQLNAPANPKGAADGAGGVCYAGIAGVPPLSSPRQAPSMKPSLSGFIGEPIRPIPPSPTNDEQKTDPEPTPTKKQAKVLELWDNDFRDKKLISRQVYGRVGGKQYALIESTLSKFGRT